MAEQAVEAQAEEGQVVRCPGCGQLIVVKPPAPPLSRFTPAEGAAAPRDFRRPSGTGGKP